MPRRSPNPRTSFFGLSFLGGIFVLLVVYGLILFIGGMISYVVYPTPIRFGVRYGMIFALTFMALGRCVASDVDWALPASVIAVIVNAVLLFLAILSSFFDFYLNGNTTSLASAAVYGAMLAASALVAVLLYRQLTARRVHRQRQPQRDQRDAGPVS